MESSKITQIIDYCLSEGKKLELPWCEFKQNFHSTEELGANISALANMARIHGRSDAYIIFGINPDDHSPVGTTFNPRLQKGAVDLGKIKPFDPNSKTRKHRKYIPFWVN